MRLSFWGIVGLILYFLGKKKKKMLLKQWRWLEISDPALPAFNILCNSDLMESFYFLGTIISQDLKSPLKDVLTVEEAQHVKENYGIFLHSHHWVHPPAASGKGKDRLQRIIWSAEKVLAATYLTSWPIHLKVFETTQKEPFPTAVGLINNTRDPHLPKYWKIIGTFWNR